MLTLPPEVFWISTYSSFPPAGPRTWNPEITTPLGDAMAWVTVSSAAAIHARQRGFDNMDWHSGEFEPASLRGACYARMTDMVLLGATKIRQTRTAQDAPTR